MTDPLPFSKAVREPARYASDIITITSKTGVGSTRSLEELQLKLGTMVWRYISGGDIMREAARGLGMSIGDFAAHNRAHPEQGYDHYCDERLSQFGRQNYTIIEARLGHVFVPHAFHVLLECDIEIRAQRRHGDGGGVTLDTVRRHIEARDEDDDQRYEQIYPGCSWRPNEFDLVVNTGEHGAPEVCLLILGAHGRWKDARVARLSTEVLFTP